jgi:alpha-glucuronidase
MQIALKERDFMKTNLGRSNMNTINIRRHPDSGYDAWLAFAGIDKDGTIYSHTLPESIYTFGRDPLLDTARDELKCALKLLTGKMPKVVDSPAKSGSILLEILAGPVRTDSFVPEEEWNKLGSEGYIIKYCNTASGKNLLITAKTGAGVLYGVYALLRLVQCGTLTQDIYLLENPVTGLRMLNHWDNLDGKIERGYAGSSIFFEDNKFIMDLSRIRDYARLMASIGLNAVVMNNVNVHKTETNLITSAFLPKVAKVAEIFRKYGIKTFLSINYCSTMEIGKLDTADPLDEGVKSWWANKAKEIFETIPDFGGFLVKADSEFRPGPFTYGRNHAEGANMLAAALEPFGGLVIWRCFVYNCTQDWRDRVTDRANAAYDNFMPLDGLFADNVLLQIKSGPMDFQVREPVSPLLGGLKKTNFVLEFQITQEYTGQQRHLCYLAPLWKDVFDFDTYRDGAGSTIASLLSGAAASGRLSGITAVANIGNDMNWTGHDLAQANFYCYGRLAWNPGLSSEEIAKEWVIQTFGCNPHLLDTITGMLLESHHIYESYTSPLGIGWMVNPNQHYGPNVDGYEYSAWGTYHRADHEGLGVDRTVAAGTGYAGRYNKPVSELYENPKTCPEELLLFFHRVLYKQKLKSGKTLIQHIYDSHFEGTGKAEQLVIKWSGMKDLLPPQTFERVLNRLAEQAKHSKEWCDVVNSYFYRKSGIPDNKGRQIY